MTHQQWTALQPRIVELQRLALHLAELGERAASMAALQTVMRIQRIKPTKEGEGT